MGYFFLMSQFIQRRAAFHLIKVNLNIWVINLSAYKFGMRSISYRHQIELFSETALSLFSIFIKNFLNTFLNLLTPVTILQFSTLDWMTLLFPAYKFALSPCWYCWPGGGIQGTTMGWSPEAQYPHLVSRKSVLCPQYLFSAGCQTFEGWDRGFQSGSGPAYCCVSLSSKCRGLAMARPHPLFPKDPIKC